MKRLTRNFLFYSLMFACVLCTAEGVWEVTDAEAHKDYSKRMPDLTQYNEHSLQKMLTAKHSQKGVVGLVRMFDQLSLSSFTAGERAKEWAKRQSSHPQAIVVSDGVVTLKEVFDSISDKRYIEKVNSTTYILRLPLVVERGAILIADNSEVSELRLSLERGSFVSVAGDLFTKDISVVGWSEAISQPAKLESENQFRPFVVGWDGGGIYMLRTVLKSLGYNESKSYGLSLSVFTTAAKKKVKEQLPSPTGWILESTFDDLYFGFYCYEAKNVVVLNNTYKNNIIYGIDPHDRSEGLIIAGNEVYGTKKKHGIIASRDVNHSWIINNKSHHNKLSGIVLDRMCEDNFIGGNEAYENGADGITLYESGDNTIWNNHVHHNLHHGVRVRNSTEVLIVDNNIVANGRVGILGLSEDLSHTDRDFIKDPYEISLGLELTGGVLAANLSGALRIDNPDYFSVTGVDMLYPAKPSNVLFRGFLRDKTHDILSVMAQKNKVISYKKSPTSQPVRLSGQP